MCKSLLAILLQLLLFASGVIGGTVITQEGPDLRVSWDANPCETCTFPSGGATYKYKLRIKLSYTNSVEYFTNDRCFLVPIDTLNVVDFIAVSVFYCGKRHTSGGSCRWWSWQRDLSHDQALTLPELVPGYNSVSSSALQRIKNDAFSKCTYFHSGLAYVWTCWNDPGMRFLVDSADDVYRFQYHRPGNPEHGKCLVPRHNGQNADLISGSCNSCQASFRKFHDTQYQNIESGRCMYTRDYDGNRIHQWSCYAPTSDSKGWDLEDI